MTPEEKAALEAAGGRVVDVEVTYDKADPNYENLMKLSAQIVTATSEIAEFNKTKAEEEGEKEALRVQLMELEKSIKRKVSFSDTVSAGTMKDVSDVMAEAKVKEPDNPNAGYEALLTTTIDNDLVRDVKRASDDLALVYAAMRTNKSDSMIPTSMKSPLVRKSYRRWSRLSAELRSQLKATTDPLTSTDSGEGADWIPSMLSSELLDGLYRQALRVPGLFREVIMPSDPFKFPMLTGKCVATAEAETATVPADLYTASASSAPTTGALTLDAKKSKVIVPMTGELNEESVIAVLPFLQSEVITALAEGEEKAEINGHAGATNVDYDTPDPATDSLYLGLSHFGVESSATVNAAAALAIAAIESALKAMGKWSVINSDVAIVCHFGGYWSLMTEASSPLKDASQLGSSVPLLTGQLGSVYGKPIFASEFCRENVNASGYNENGGTNTKARANVFNRTRWIRGSLRKSTVEGFRDPFHDLHWVIARKRSAFKCLDTAGATVEHTRTIINITP